MVYPERTAFENINLVRDERELQYLLIGTIHSASAMQGVHPTYVVDHSLTSQGLAVILGYILAYGIAHVPNPSLRVYQIIILICGAVSLVALVPVTLAFPSRPSQARFLSHDEKRIALERVRQNQQGTSCAVWKWAQVKECMRDAKTWIWMLMLFCISLVSGGIGNFSGKLISASTAPRNSMFLTITCPGAAGR